jgi:hypothetical protein
MGYSALPTGKDELLAWQNLSLSVHRNLRAHTGKPVLGLTYRSRRRGCSGQVFALFTDLRDASARRPFVSDG